MPMSKTTILKLLGILLRKLPQPPILPLWLDNAANTSRHPTYYFEDGTIIFRVEDTLFKLHKYLLIGSDLFRDILFLPQDAKKPEGLTDGRPIKLADVKVSDFVCLCQFLYPAFNNRFDGSFEDWAALLDLSTKFQSKSIRNAAITQLEAIDGHTVQKIILARRHDIPGWLIPLYIAMSRQNDLISPEEAKLLGAETVLALAKVRESSRSGTLRNSSHSVRCPHCNTLNTITEPMVESAFSGL